MLKGAVRRIESVTGVPVGVSSCLISILTLNVVVCATGLVVAAARVLNRTLNLQKDFCLPVFFCPCLESDFEAIEFDRVAVCHLDCHPGYAS